MTSSAASRAHSKRRSPEFAPPRRPATGSGSELADQARVATPEQALADGADLLVIGRPITGAADPAAAAEAIAASL